MAPEASTLTPPIIISKQLWPVRASPSVPPIPAGTKPDAEDRSRSSPRPEQASPDPKDGN
ncbi:hypothetical protein GJ744_002401 [Endocarpon pusillum]|uniref:Uncharacterized protein n=1 Tax=Endocarpon pusillum TaxID=364733 RepID=A0A8H7ARK0_9EURO|nr:hypothetical protein GJ744_002401 [Endocarpon pusillum]